MRMSFINHQVSRLWTVILKPLMLWIVSKTTPENPHDFVKDLDGHIVYALPKRSYLDRLVLRSICQKHRLPVPEYDLDIHKKNAAGMVFINESGVFRSKKSLKPHRGLISLLKLQKKNPDRPIYIVPISPFWGKNPGREEQSIWRLIFNDDENAGWLQRAFIILFQGRNNFVYFSPPMRLKVPNDEKDDLERDARKLRRVLRIHFRRQRNTVLGKELYVREHVVSRVARGHLVRSQIETELKNKSGRSTLRSLETKARRYARELAADQRYSMVRMFELMLARLWNKLFDGVEVKNLENVRELAEKDYEIVYISTHRSHLDYLLTSYIIYRSGLPSPHIAAGINLNFWPIGWFLRRAGAFFIRRSFRGNRLYTAVVNEYIHYLLTHGYPITLFPEGGRSRTGKLLPLKTGMLSMIVQSFIRNHQRPVALIPVYLGYDKVMEVGSYMKELSGKSKKKESALALLRARKFLSLYYGKAYVSLGDPIILGDFFNEKQADWKDFAGELERPEWMPQLVQSVADELAIRMNEPVVANPISLVALGLLSTPQKALSKEELVNFVDMIIELNTRCPFSKNSTILGKTGEQILAAADQLKMFSYFRHVGGDVLHLKDVEGILISYYRNNIIHCVALPSLIARFFQYQVQVELKELIRGCAEIYPFLKEEFHLPWSEESIDEVLLKYIGCLIDLGMLIKDQKNILHRPVPSYDQSVNLNILGNCLGLTFERYTITAAILSRYTAVGHVEEKAFELQCQKMAQRLAILNGIHNPEVTEKSFVSKHVQMLKKRKLLIPLENGDLQIDEKVASLAKSSMKLLSHDARYSIDRIFMSK